MSSNSSGENVGNAFDVASVLPIAYALGSATDDTFSDVARVPIDQMSSNKAVSLSSAGVRALFLQLQTLYLRTPVKLFRPSRFDYMVYVREQVSQSSDILSKPYRFHTHSGLALLARVIREKGWKIIPDQILPPLIANSATGVILYATYLTTLDAFDKKRHNELSQSHSQKRKNHVYSTFDTWRAGLIAGAVQSIVAAPLDAIYSRLTLSDRFEGKHQGWWKYVGYKLKQIGVVGVFAGFGFSLVKESLGFAFYFSTFELVKTRGYNLTYNVISRYRKLKASVRNFFGYSHDLNMLVNPEVISLEQKRLTRILKSSFILLAGASAAFSLLAVQYPLSKVQQIHFGRLELLDQLNASANYERNSILGRLYPHSYIDTYNRVKTIKAKSNLSWFSLAYKGFVRNALTMIPSTSIGLLVFEIMRTKLSDSLEDTAPFET